MITDVNSANFDSEVLKADKIVLVDFWADWCGPCKMVMPLVNEIATETADSVKVVKVNIEENPELVERFNVRSIPYFLLFINGNIVMETVGRLDRAKMYSAITKYGEK